MDKKLIAAAAAMLLLPAAAAAQALNGPKDAVPAHVSCATCPATAALKGDGTGYFIPDKGRPFPGDRPGEGARPPEPPKVSLSEAAAGAEDSKDKAKKKKTLKAQAGGEVKTSYVINVPKGRWRILWRIKPADAKERGIFKLKTDVPKKTDYYQEMIKEIGPQEYEAFGSLNVCEESGGDFNVSLDAKKVTWEIEIQTLYE
ncbi:MAG TPA: hypothetical protein DEQ38_14175 [Elusimicrobia bacterium]|nr:MAG: hypothetical protein A2089_07115 [Elusimicrobia bacterium GWD2_63_28]HCC49244.1 hypothetical protein [Elusimicrobiota bacterium]